MPFVQTKTNRNFSVSAIHKFLNFESGPNGSLVAVVNSYATMDAFMAPDHLLNWQDRFPIPTTAAVDPEAWLISSEGPFAGATALVMDTELELARSLQWARIKTIRKAIEVNGLPYLGSLIQTDPESTVRLQNQVLRAQAAIASGESFVLNWTTKDNSVLTLSAEEVVGIPIALAEFQDNIHQISSTLRQHLFDPDTNTPEKIQAISWPI